jgi:uncharacterized cupin superfamily protein
MTSARMMLLACLALCLFGCSEHLSPLDFQSSHVMQEDLVPSTIPAHWVREGEPKARVKELTKSSDDGITARLWDCTAGKFEWHFTDDEFVHILLGEVEVTGAGGRKQTLRAGDVAFFPAGMRSVWHVPKYVKKLAILRDNDEPFLHKLHRKWTELVG